MWHRGRVDKERDPAKVEDLEKEFRENNKTTKTEVDKMKEAIFEEMYEDLKKNNPKNLYNLAKSRKRRALDIDKRMFIKGGEGNIICSDSELEEMA